jgi:hypothetical protein
MSMRSEARFRNFSFASLGFCSLLAGRKKKTSLRRLKQGPVLLSSSLPSSPSRAASPAPPQARIAAGFGSKNGERMAVKESEREGRGKREKEQCRGRLVFLT